MPVLQCNVWFIGRNGRWCIQVGWGQTKETKQTGQIITRERWKKTVCKNGRCKVADRFRLSFHVLVSGFVFTAWFRFLAIPSNQYSLLMRQWARARSDIKPLAFNGIWIIHDKAQQHAFRAFSTFQVVVLLLLLLYRFSPVSPVSCVNAICWAGRLLDLIKSFR